jgi:uncharacterized protein YigA (DUF484 family)
MNRTHTRESASFKQNVVNYLRENPDFFADHPELLSVLTIPHPSGQASSLVERQLAVLREQNQDMDRRLHELVSVARENDQLSERMQRLALALVGTETLERTLATVRETMRQDFDASYVVLRIGVRNPDRGVLERELVGPDDPGLLLFDDFFKIARPKCGRVQVAQSQYLFGDQSADVGSVALIPLKGKHWQGVLAVGDDEADRFQPGMGTLFLGRMGELISAALNPFVHGRRD